MIFGGHAVKTVLLVPLLALTLSAGLSPPDPFTQVLYTVPLFVMTLPVAHFALKRVA